MERETGFLRRDAFGRTATFSLVPTFRDSITELFLDFIFLRMDKFLYKLSTFLAFDEFFKFDCLGF